MMRIEIVGGGFGGLAAAKEIVNQRVGLVPPADFAATQKKFFEA
jgi:NADH dehydrogenase FAD-containing subunit